MNSADAAAAVGGLETLQVHLLQLNSTDQIDSNWQRIQGLLQLLERKPEAQFVSLPENALYLRIKEGETIPGMSLEDPIWKEIQETSRALNLVLHFGSVPLKKGTKLTNASVIVTPDGGIHSPYSKIHLFDIHLENQSAIRESDVFEFGDRTSIFEWQGWKFGLSICYDLRFAELYLHYAKQQVDAILVPAAFLVPTGQAHWEVLLRARAIESQCYVLAAAQAGTHRSVRGVEATRQTFGHSLGIDPWGKVLVQGASEGSQILSFEMRRAEINRVRRQIPMAAHRRL